MQHFVYPSNYRPFTYPSYNLGDVIHATIPFRKLLRCRGRTRVIKGRIIGTGTDKLGSPYYVVTRNTRSVKVFPHEIWV
jgi:hypothetical protein